MAVNDKKDTVPQTKIDYTVQLVSDDARTDTSVSEGCSNQMQESIPITIECKNEAVSKAAVKLGNNLLSRL